MSVVDSVAVCLNGTLCPQEPELLRYYIYIYISWFCDCLNCNREFRKKALRLIEVTFSTMALFYALKDATITTGLSISNESIALKINFVVIFEKEKRETSNIKQIFIQRKMMENFHRKRTSETNAREIT